MIAQPKNRVQAIKSKFESLNKDNITKDNPHLIKQTLFNTVIVNKENAACNIQYDEKDEDSESSNDSWVAQPNMSYLHTKNEDKKPLNETKKLLSRQTSDPCKKLHRSHAFRCDRSKVVSPKRHGSCYGRPETSGFSLNMEKKLPKDKLRKLSSFIEDQMRKDTLNTSNENIVGQVLEVKDAPLNSIPDSEVPKHILDQYAKVVKPKNNDVEKKECTTDSGVSSETEELKNIFEEEKSSVKRLTCQFENSENNLHSMNDLCASSETIKLERKNPNLILTSTLKKALKQPLPPGPPPKKPPRTFVVEKEKKDAKKMLEKLEQVLQKRESNTLKSESSVSRSVKEPKEIHYLCTEILDITHRTLLPNSVNNCLKSLNCAVMNNSTLSLPYARLSNGLDRQSFHTCSCSSDNLTHGRTSTFLDTKCARCQINSQKHDEFKCHLDCKCRTEMSKFYVEKEHIYDEPCVDDEFRNERRNHYGSLNHSKSMEDLRTSALLEDQKIYDIPCEISRPATPEAFEPSSSPKVPESPSSSSPKVPESPSSSSPKVPESPSSSSPKVPKSPTPQSPKASQSPSPEIRRPGLHRLKSIFENPIQNENTVEIQKIGIGQKTDFQKLKESFENVKRESVHSERESIDRCSKKFGDLEKEFNRNSKNFGNSENDTEKFSTSKPPTRPKPIFIKNNSKSSENLNETKQEKEKKFSTEGRRHLREKNGENRRSLTKKDSTQLDVDRENLNQLMTEIYETVACSMAADTPGRFPAETSDSTSEDSVKLTRSLTEKRKNYVRRVSSRVAYLETKNVKQIRHRHQTSICTYKPENLEHPYSTFRSWKSFRTSQNNLNNKTEVDSPEKMADSPKRSIDSGDRISIDEKTGCVDIALPFEPRERGLFNVCLLVGLNYLTGEAYVKTVFPAQVQVPAHIENLIFPETLTSSSKGEWTADAKAAQCYSLVLTDEKGERSYGYCRRVLPEGAGVCLPLCYCLIGKYRAPGFYYKVLQEIESHHGRSELEIHSILTQLFESDFPNPGEHITVSNTRTNRHSNNMDKCKTMPDMRKSECSEYSYKSDFRSEYLDNSEFGSDFSENNNGSHVYLDLEGPRMKLIKRPIEPRADENNLSVLLDSLGAGLTVKIFGSLLLERKVLICGEQLSQVSSCMEALQMALYPFVWQQPLISTIPAEIEREVLEAPLPMLAGLLLTSGRLDTSGVVFEEGMLIDLSHSSKVLFCQGDEATILPTSSFKTLKTALQMEYKKDRIEDTKTRNVMISEAFLRFFVDILGDFWKYFSVGELKDGDFGKGNIIFDKESFIKNTTSKQNQYFLEWFTETAMFNHFIQNMAAMTPTNCQTPNVNFQTPNVNCQTPNVNLTSNVSETSRLVDAPLPDFYDLFNERVKSRTKMETNKFDKSNYKSAMNKRMKLLKTKLKELVA